MLNDDPQVEGTLKALCLMVKSCNIDGSPHGFWAFDRGMGFIHLYFIVYLLPNILYF